MIEKIKAFIQQEEGAETMEYVAIAAVVIILGIAAYQTGSISDTVSAGLSTIESAITGIT